MYTTNAISTFSIPEEKLREQDRKKSIIMILFLAPLIGEVISLSTSFIGYLIPWNLILLMGLYGFGALIAHELTIRWKKGGASLLLLGIAYGIIEEGLFLLSFFNPAWGAIGILGQYGRWWEVNWIWTFELIIFHMVYSIAIPVSLTRLMYPRVQSETWLSDRALKCVIGLFFVPCGFIWFLYGSSVMPLGIDYSLQYFFFVILTVLFISMAWMVSNPFKIFSQESNSNKNAYSVNQQEVSPKSPAYYFWGFLGCALFFLIVWVLPSWNIHPILIIVILISWVGFIIYYIANLSNFGVSWTPLEQLQFISGILGFMMFVGILFALGGVYDQILAVFVLWFLLNKIKVKIISNQK